MKTINEKIGLRCLGCHHDILRREINNLLIDNRGAWHQKCYAPEPTENEAAKGVSIAA